MLTLRDVRREFVKRSRRYDLLINGDISANIDNGADRLINSAQSMLDELSGFNNGGPFIHGVTLPANQYFINLPRTANVRERGVTLLTPLDGWVTLDSLEYEHILEQWPIGFTLAGDDGPYYWTIVSNLATIQQRDWREVVRDVECLDSTEWSYSGWTYASHQFNITAPPGVIRNLIHGIDLAAYQRYVQPSFAFTITVVASITAGTMLVSMTDWFTTMSCVTLGANQTFTHSSIWKPTYTGVGVTDVAVPLTIAASAAFVGSVHSISLKLYAYNTLPAVMAGTESSRFGAEGELTLLLAPTSTSDKSLRIEADTYTKPLEKDGDHSFWTQEANFQTLIEATQYTAEGELKGEGVGRFHLERILGRLNVLDSDEAERELRRLGW